MSAWQGQPVATPPGSASRLNPSTPSTSATSTPEVQTIVKLVRSDPDFRNELKSVIAEALQPELAKLKNDLLVQMSASNAASASSGVPPPMDYESIIQREFPGSVLEEWSHLDEQGSVYGFAETVSTHVIKHNNMAFLCDIKEAVDISDVVFLIRIGKLYKSANPAGGLACIIICRFISPKAKALADKCKMKTMIAP